MTERKNHPKAATPAPTRTPRRDAERMPLRHQRELGAQFRSEADANREQAASSQSHRMKPRITVTFDEFTTTPVTLKLVPASMDTGAEELPLRAVRNPSLFVRDARPKSHGASQKVGPQVRPVHGNDTF